MATVTLTTNCVLNEDGSVTLTATISDVTGVPAELFLYKIGKTSNTDSYYGVASPWEITKYPTSRDSTKPFYRLSTATLQSPDAASATLVKNSLSGFLKETIDAYEVFLAVAGSESTIIESDV